MIVPFLELLVQLAIVSICIICQADTAATAAPKRSSGKTVVDNSAKKAASRTKASDLVVTNGSSGALSKEVINDEEAAELKRKIRTLQQKSSKQSGSTGKSDPQLADKASPKGSPGPTKRVVKIKKKDKERDNYEDATEFESVNAAKKPALSKLRRKNSKCTDSITSTSVSRSKSSAKKKDKKKSSSRLSKEKDNEKEKEKTHNDTEEEERPIKKKSSSKRISVATKEVKNTSIKPNRPRPKTRRDESLPSIQRGGDKRRSLPNVATSKEQLPIEEFDMSKNYIAPHLRKAEEVDAKDDDLAVAPTIDCEAEELEVTCVDDGDANQTLKSSTDGNSSPNPSPNRNLEIEDK